MKAFFTLLPLLLPLSPSAILHEDLQVQLEHASAAIQALPGIAELYLDRAELYRLDRDFEAARLDLQEAQSLGLGLSTFRWGFVHAKVDRDSGNARAALEVVRGLLEERTRTPAEGCQALQVRAELAGELGFKEEALVAWDTLLQLHAHPDPDWYLQRAHLQEDAPALKGLLQGIGRLGHVPSLLLEASAREEHLGHPLAACEFLQVLAKKSPRKETWLSKEGDILWRAGLQKEAVAKYRAALGALRRLPHHKRITPSMLDLSRALARKLGDAEEAKNNR